MRPRPAGGAGAISAPGTVPVGRGPASRGLSRPSGLSKSSPVRPRVSAGDFSTFRLFRRGLTRTLLCLALPALFASQASAQTTPSLTVTPATVPAADFDGGGTVTLTLTPVNRTFLGSGGEVPGSNVAALLDLSSITSSNASGPINFSAAGLALITLSAAPTGLTIDSGRLLDLDTSHEDYDHRSAEIVLSYSGTAISSATTVTVNVGADLIRGADFGSSGKGPALSSNFTIINATAANPLVRIAAGPGVTEGSPATYTLTAMPSPAADLTVNYTVADAPGANFVAPGDEGSGKTATLTTTGMATISVPTATDTVDEPSGPVTVTVNSGTGYTPETVDLVAAISSFDGLDGGSTITDNLAAFSIEDPGTITVSPTSLSLIEGNPAKGYTVVLGSDPGAAVAVTATSNDGAAQVRAGSTGAFGSSATLNFTHGATGNWSTAQTVEVRATPNDGDTATALNLHQLTGNT